MAFSIRPFRPVRRTGSRMTMRVVYLVVVAALLAGAVHAGSEGYVCTVATFSRLADDGTLRSDGDDPIIGQEFTVDRQSGKIIGRYMASGGYTTTVLDFGSSSQTFKVLAKTPEGLFVHILYLEIQEFRKEILKPFLLVDSSLVYSGRCK
jgi:hypothetical protein